MTSLLPPFQRTPQEAAYDDVIGRRISGIPVPLPDIKNPLLCDEDFLPWLAWEFSVDIWHDDWPVERKRFAISEAIRMHRIKGTLGGIKAHVSLAGAAVVGARVPPDAFFPDPATTKAERDAFQQRFPQIRIYDYRSGATRDFGAYFRSGYRLDALFLGAFFPRQTDAIARIGSRGFLYEPKTGVESPITRVVRTQTVETRTAREIEEYRVGTTDNRSFFLGSIARRGGRMFPTKLSAASRVYTLEVQRDYDHRSDALHLTTYSPSLEPVSVRPQSVAQPGSRVSGQLYARLGGRATEFFGSKRIFLPPSSAPLRLYRRVYLHDPDRAPALRGAQTFCGYFRLGMPPFHAQIRISTPSTQPRHRFARYVSGFLVETSKERVEEARRAIGVSKALRDTVLMTTKTKRPLRAGDRPKVGTVRVGQWTRD
jgi:hypothetical protein